MDSAAKHLGRTDSPGAIGASGVPETAARDLAQMAADASEAGFPTVAAVLKELARARAPRPLTAVQQETLDVIRRCVEANGYPPTVREIAAHFGIAAHAAFCRLEALKAKGTIYIENARGRGIRIVGVRWLMVSEEDFEQLGGVAGARAR